MKVLFDTSVLVAAIIQAHPHHAQALPWLSRAKAGEVGFVISSHTLAELYSVLSGLPTKPKISPSQAWQLVQQNVAKAQIVELTASDYTGVLQRVSELGLSGGVVYDALIVRAAEKAGADRILTLHQKDFRRVSPDGESLLLSP